jgi:hypothetical protein
MNAGTITLSQTLPVTLRVDWHVVEDNTTIGNREALSNIITPQALRNLP